MAYSHELVGDLYKDAFGFRPSPQWWNSWTVATEEGRQQLWDSLCAVVEQGIAQERIQATQAEAAFLQLIAEQNCATFTAAVDQLMAVAGERDLDYWLWLQGIEEISTASRYIKLYNQGAAQ